MNNSHEIFNEIKNLEAQIAELKARGEAEDLEAQINDLEARREVLKRTFRAAMISYSPMDDYMWSVRMYLIGHYGDDARMEGEPLARYIQGASEEFLEALVDTQVSKVARACHKGGTDEEVLNRIKSILNF